MPDSAIEERIKELRNAVAEVKDLQIVNKLDIINLKNEIERLSLAQPLVEKPEAPAPELKGMEEKIKKLEEGIQAAQKRVQILPKTVEQEAETVKTIQQLKKEAGLLRKDLKDVNERTLKDTSALIREKSELSQSLKTINERTLKDMSALIKQQSDLGKELRNELKATNEFVAKSNAELRKQLKEINARLFKSDEEVRQKTKAVLEKEKHRVIGEAKSELKTYVKNGLKDIKKISAHAKKRVNLAGRIINNLRKTYGMEIENLKKEVNHITRTLEMIGVEKVVPEEKIKKRLHKLKKEIVKDIIKELEKHFRH